MHDFIHSHLSYDQIITEDEPTEQQRQTRIKRRPLRDKPFKIEKVHHPQPTNSMKKLKTEEGSLRDENPQTVPLRRLQPDNKSSVAYESDFEFFEEEVQESIINDHTIKDASVVNQLAMTRKNKNYSAVLPRIEKIAPDKLKPSVRETGLSNSKSGIMKSTVELRQENKKLVREIETFRNFLPIFKRNQAIIIKQSQELNKIKSRRFKFFDVSYELSLDKNMERQIESIENMQEKIRSEESMLKYKKSRVKKNHRGVRVSRVKQEQIQDEESSLISEFIKLREHVLSKRRQEQAYQKKMQELDSKLAQYHSILDELDERAKIGVHEELKRRKIVLEFDLQMKKTQLQEKECQLLVEIAELNNRSSQLQLKCCSIASELSAIALSKEQSKRMSMKVGNKACQSGEVDASPKKQATRLLKLFGRRN